ncbi:hypothetical protein, partial [Bordetella pertussis]|uniref:hypothetical protein n=1 Tax=Bordetella pertussis TaxID=520 RepID=UPI001FEE700C
QALARAAGVASVEAAMLARWLDERGGRAGRWRNSLAGARLAAGERAWRRRRASRRRRRATV